jgi:hypothetical protein
VRVFHFFPTCFSVRGRFSLLPTDASSILVPPVSVGSLGQPFIAPSQVPRAPELRRRRTQFADEAAKLSEQIWLMWNDTPEITKSYG